MDQCRTIMEVLSRRDTIQFFNHLSSKSSDKHVRFTSVLICWPLNKQNLANQEYSPELIKTCVHYPDKCGDDSLHQCHGVPIDTMITIFTGVYIGSSSIVVDVIAQEFDSVAKEKSQKKISQREICKQVQI